MSSGTNVSGIVVDVEAVKAAGQSLKDLRDTVRDVVKGADGDVKEAHTALKGRGGEAGDSMPNLKPSERGRSAVAATGFISAAEELDATVDEAERSLREALKGLGDWTKDAASAQENLDEEVAKEMGQ